MHHSVDVAHGNQPRSMGGVQIKKGVAHVPPGEGASSLWVFGELVTHKIPSQQTGGAYSLFEITAQPGIGPPPHVQHREDESFYVLEGEYEFSIGEDVLRMGEDSLLYMPKGTLHTHKNAGEDVGRMLVVHTPGGLYERFFEEVGTPSEGGSKSLAEEDQLNLKEIAAIGVEYGIEIPPPVAKHGRA